MGGEDDGEAKCDYGGEGTNITSLPCQCLQVHSSLMPTCGHLPQEIVYSRRKQEVRTAGNKRRHKTGRTRHF